MTESTVRNFLKAVQGTPTNDARLIQGVMVVDNLDGTMFVSAAGMETTVKKFTSYLHPVNGETIWLVVQGASIMALGPLGNRDDSFATTADLASHLGDLIDAHHATAISFIAGGTIVATNVQDAINEVDSENQSDHTIMNAAIAARAALAGDTFTGNVFAPKVGVNASAFSTVEKLRVNTPATADVSANATFNASAATSKPAIFQGAAAQSAVLVDFQSSAGASLANVSAVGLGTFSGLTLTDGTDFVVGTGTGTKFGTATNQKQAWFGATPVVQQGSDVNALVTYGLMSSISAINFTKEVAATIRPAATTTAATAGAALSVIGGEGSGTTSGAGGALSLTGGAGVVGNSGGGAVSVTGGGGVNTSTAGAVNIAGGFALVGGAVNINGGNGTTTGAINIGVTRGDVNLSKTGGKIGAFGVAAIVRPTNAIAASAFVANTSGIVNDTATWGGYTIGQVVKALINLGWLT